MTDALRLFLIEDDPDIVLLIRKSLERASHQVTCCRTAADALIVLAQTSFDLVLLDQKLPDMEGLDLLHTLAREGISVPVLMVTAHGDEKLATRVLHAGALDYVVKDPALTFLTELPKRVAESVTRHRLEQMNRLLIQALESARDGIIITDLQGTIIKVNQALVAMTGYSRQELLGQTPRLLKSKVHPPEMYVNMWRTILARKGWQGELTNRRKDGTLYPISITISPIEDAQGRLTHFVGIERDISEHKQLERQLLQAQKMQSVGTLAGGVAHEFNNLLAGISGYASLGLREPNLSPTLREFLHHIVGLSERAATLTRQLLAFARKPALSRQRTAVRELITSTADLVRHSLHQEVVLDINEPSDPREAWFVEADANQLQQALVNLALNARDAIRERVTRDTRGEEPPGRPGSTLRLAAPAPVGAAGMAIVIRARNSVLTQDRPGFPQHVPQGDYVLLEVQDQGSGMPSEILNQALDPFFTTKDVGQGTGLGLPMVFGIVQGHQGFMTIESVVGQGTAVGLYLPRLLEGAGLDHRENLYQDSEIVEPESMPSRAILVVDDEEAVLDVVRRFLQIAGHEVRCVASGQEALDLLSQGATADLIILDVMMPRENAATTFHRLRQRRAGVPILLCTGLPQAEPAPELLRQNAVSLIRKPFRMNELWYAVKRLLVPPNTRRDSSKGEAEA
jgi:PAS domain S-box-containing protein